MISRLLCFTLLLLILSACGSAGGSTGGGGAGEAVDRSSSSEAATTSSSSSSVSSARSSSSVVSSSSVAKASVPNAASNGYPYCRYDNASDGWGWENGHNCIVYQSDADPGVGEFDHCKVGAAEIDYCANGDSDWQFADGAYCMARDLCPGNGAKTQTPAADALVTGNPTPQAQAVFDYLHDIWGEKMLSGQMDLTWADEVDMRQRVMDDTGKTPALMGYDFMNYGVYASGSGLHQTEEAIEHWENGGLVTFTWHWRDPSGETVNFYANQDDDTKNTDFTIPVKDGELDRDSEAFLALQNDVDLIAGELQTLEDAGVPVLWRPLHEAAGGWFWWGRQRSDEVPAAYAQTLLWHYLYERFTEYHSLNNLIWVWNGQNAIWYPGDDVVDIVSTDIYDGERNYESQAALYGLTQSYPHQIKPVALSENSNIPDPDAMQADGAWWLWFMVWNDGALNTTDDHPSNFWTGEYYNTDAHKAHVYNHALVITLSELPEFSAP